MSKALRSWIVAARPRTLPLAAASICMGGFLAFAYGKFSWTVFLLTLLTTLLLQILSNLANDYGDYQHGADHQDRIGPPRMVQSGLIAPHQMKNGLIITCMVTFGCGIWLLIRSFGFNTTWFYVFLCLGLLCIAAAIYYTAGHKPYGYEGWGDLSVIIFFGFVAVFGTYFLQTSRFQWINFLPALSCGLFATAVLNINNIRDLDSDKKAGKLSIPVRIGPTAAIKYHWALLFIGLLSSVLFVAINFVSPWQWLFLAVVPLLIINGKAVQNLSGKELDPYLRQMALTTLLYVLTFGLGLILAAGW